MSVTIEEGKVGDIIGKGIQGLQDIVNTSKNIHGYLTGDRTSTLDHTVKATDDDLEKTPFRSFIKKNTHYTDKEFKYTAKKDKNGHEVAVTFNASSVPKRLAYLCTNGDASGSMKQYVKSYKNGVVTMVFPLDDQGSISKAFNSNKKDKKDKDSNKSDKTTITKKRKRSAYKKSKNDGWVDTQGNPIEGESMMTPVQVKKRGYKCDKNGHIIIDEEEGNREVVKEDYHGRYQEIGHKSVQDSDGFWTDYTMYHNLDDDTYVMIFGDNEIYSPYNTEPDFECDTREEADEWFDSYEGFVDDEEEYSVDEPDWDPDEEVYVDFDSYDGPTVYDENPEYNEWEDEGLTLKNEDYWFGGDGKIDNEHRPDKSFNSKDDQDSSEDEEDSKDDSSKNDQDDQDHGAESAFDDSDTDELPESIMNETPGLTLSTPEVNSQGILEIEINGKKYKYSCNNPDTSSEEIASTVKKMQKYSDGKALAYLKKNMKLVTESVNSEISKGKWAVLTRKERKVDPDTYFIIHIDSFDGKRSVGGFTPNGHLREYDISKIKYVCDSESEAQQWIDKKQINESVVVSEKLDGSIKDDIRTDVINAFYEAAKSEDFGFESDDDIDKYYTPHFEVEDFGGDRIRVEVRFESDYEGMGLMAEELNPVVQKYDPNAYFDFVDVGIMEAFIEADLEEEFIYNESIQDQDGWSEDVVGLFDEYIKKSDDLSYELRTTVRGAMTGARTVSELVQYVDELQYMLDEISSELESSEQELTESNPFKSHHICQGCGKPLSKCTCGVQEEDVDLSSLEEDYEVQRNKTITVDLEDNDASFERLIKYIKSVADSGRFFSVIVDPDEEDLKKEFYINGEDGFDINKIKTEDSVEDVEIKESLSEGFLTVGKELTSKSGHKIKITAITPVMSEYDGSPYIGIDYDYELTDGRKGSSNCDTVDLFKMLQEDTVKECTQPSSIGQHKVSEIVDPDANKEDEEDPLVVH